MKLALLSALACLAALDVANGESMMQAFQKFRSQKNNNGNLPSNLKGLVCDRSGSNPKSIYCFNKHGVRCSKDFLQENERCAEERVSRCPDKNQMNEKGQWCVTFRGKNWYSYTLHGPCVKKGDIAEDLCARPCGCIMDGSPKRESRGVMQTKTLNGDCLAGSTWGEVQKELGKWGVPRETYDNFEMSLFGESSHFAVFDLFIQPKKNEARYGLAIGAGRCHGNKVEVGYMYTGMWKVDTVNNYKCHWKGGCSGVGISEENIDNARKVLEWYAWKELKISGRRLRGVAAEEEMAFPSRELKGDLFEGMDELDEGGDEEDEEDYDDEESMA